MSKRRPYKNVAERVIAAMTEWNAALAEAHEHPQVRVHIIYPTGSVAPPVQYGCEVTRITKHEVPLADRSGWDVAYKLRVAEMPAKKRKSKAGRKAS